MSTRRYVPDAPVNSHHWPPPVRSYAARSAAADAPATEGWSTAASER